jgi:hypothetical protein
MLITSASASQARSMPSTIQLVRPPKPVARTL